MINSDVSSMPNRNGCVGIIRDADGIVKLIYNGISEDNSVLSQEFRVIIAGLEGSLMIRDHEATMNCDNSRAVNTLNGLE